MDRRRFITGLAGILGAGYSASILPSGVIMPIRQIISPKPYIISWETPGGFMLASTDGFVKVSELIVFNEPHTPEMTAKMTAWMMQQVGPIPEEPVAWFKYP